MTIHPDTGDELTDRLNLLVLGVEAQGTKEPTP